MTTRQAPNNIEHKINGQKYEPLPSGWPQLAPTSWDHPPAERYLLDSGLWTYYETSNCQPSRCHQWLMNPWQPKKRHRLEPHELWSQRAARLSTRLGIAETNKLRNPTWYCVFANEAFLARDIGDEKQRLSRIALSHWLRPLEIMLHSSTGAQLCVQLEIFAQQSSKWGNAEKTAAYSQS